MKDKASSLQTGSGAERLGFAPVFSHLMALSKESILLNNISSYVPISIWKKVQTNVTYRPTWIALPKLPTRVPKCQGFS